MKLTAPEYYKQFKCTDSKCRHNCCIGWEIDIDEDTYPVYKNHEGELKQRFLESISTDGGAPHFVLSENGRCPFLNENNLCDIFTHMGEENLCSICTDHPRFKNFYSGITEIGLGLCCEAACELVLKHQGFFRQIELENDGKCETLLPEESDFFEIRQKIFDILETGDSAADEKFKEILLAFGIKNTDPVFENIAQLFENLEYMEDDISRMLGDAPRGNMALNGFKAEFDRLAVYFVFRHLAGGLDDGMYVQRLMFAAVSVKAVETMCKNHLQKTGSLMFEDVAEFARIYSAEIEYSDENISKILEKITEKLS